MRRMVITTAVAIGLLAALTACGDDDDAAGDDAGDAATTTATATATATDGATATTTTSPTAGAAPLATYGWETVLDGAPWGGRAGLRVVELDGSLVVMGGRTPRNSPIPGDSDLWGDVWRSDDGGASWTRIVESGQAWPPRAYFQAVMLGDEVYVLGGQNFGFPASTFFNDVWRSTDGATWEQLTPAAPWEGRAGLMAASLDDLLFVFGGSRNDDTAVVGPTGPARIYFNDVWRSADGVTWEQLTPAAPWEPRAGGAVVVRDGELYLLGGEKGFVCSPQPDCVPPYFNDVWKTTDGVTWEQVTPAADWSPRPGHQCELLEGRIVCFGGFGQPANPVDMWASEDGASWERLPQAPWNAPGPESVRYDFDSTTAPLGPNGSAAIVTVGGDRETFDFGDPENWLRVDDDVWRFAAPDADAS